MRRILVLLTVVALMMVMLAMSVGPAFAAKPGKCFHTGGGPPHGCGVQSQGSKSSG